MVVRNNKQDEFALKASNLHFRKQNLHEICTMVGFGWQIPSQIREGSVAPIVVHKETKVVQFYSTCFQRKSEEIKEINSVTKECKVSNNIMVSRGKRHTSPLRESWLFPTLDETPHPELFTILSQHLPPPHCLLSRYHFASVSKWNESKMKLLNVFWGFLTNPSNSFPTTQIYSLEYKIWSHKNLGKTLQAQISLNSNYPALPLNLADIQQWLVLE